MSQTAQPPDTRMTVPEFLVWYEKQSEGRYELVDGVIVPMAAERVRHNRVKVRVFDVIRRRLAEKKLPCEAFADGMAITIGDRTWREPDVVVQCGGTVDGNATVLAAPDIVVEILSPSTSRVDTFAKLTEYFDVVSIRHYLIVDPDKRIAVHHARDNGGKIYTRIISTGPIVFDPPGFEIDIGDIFAGL
jgi:Uma2 family endonuclease